MHTFLCLALVAISAVHYTSASVCVVSFWADWGSCIGNCEFGLQVRNRNVVRAPFPERTRDGRLAIRACPPLYQVQTCVPDPCRNGITDFSGLNILIPASPQELRAPHDISHTNEHINADLTATIGVAEADVNQAPPMRILTPAEETLSNEIIVQPTETTRATVFEEVDPTTGHAVDSTPMVAEATHDAPTTVAPLAEITTVSATTQQTETVTTATSATTVAATTATTTVRPPTTATPIERPTTTTFIVETNATTAEETVAIENSTTAAQPVEREVERRPTVFEETTTVGVVELTSSTIGLPTPPALNEAPLAPIRLGGQGPIRVVIGERDNTTDAGVEASLPTKPSTTRSTTTTTTAAPTTTTMTPAKRRELQKAAVSRVIAEARKQGVAPNPTDIERAMRGSTDGAPCTSPSIHVSTLHLGVEGVGQCCRQPMKTECENGRAPQVVMRYYRNAGDSECVAYSYPYCSLREEAQNPPIKWEQDCYDLCYTSEEKKTMPLFKEISFNKNGFRLTAGRRSAL